MIRDIFESVFKIFSEPKELVFTPAHLINAAYKRPHNRKATKDRTVIKNARKQSRRKK